MQIEIDPKHKAYIEGVVAKLAGVSWKANPYAQETANRDADMWARGWGLTPQAQDLEV